MKPGSRGYWLLVAGYVVVLFALQPRLGFGVDAFKARWGERSFELTMTTVAVAVGLAVAALLVLAWRGATAGERALLLLGLLLYGLGVAALSIPQERLHYVEYGLLSGLFALGLEAPLRSQWKAATVAVLAAFALGAVDEMLQGLFWERRYFDWADIWLNARAAVLGAVIATPLANGLRRRT